VTRRVGCPHGSASHRTGKARSTASTTSEGRRRRGRGCPQHQASHRHFVGHLQPAHVRRVLGKGALGHGAERMRVNWGFIHGAATPWEKEVLEGSTIEVCWSAMGTGVWPWSSDVQGKQREGVADRSSNGIQLARAGGDGELHTKKELDLGRMAARWGCSRESTARRGLPDLRRAGSHMVEGAYVQEANEEPRPWGELTCSSSDPEKCPALGAWGGGRCAGCRQEVRCTREAAMGGR
jgi:hypothetical protein